MDFHSFAPVCLALFALTNWAVIPLLERRFQRARDVKSIGYGALLALAGVFRGFFLMATLASIAFTAMVAVLRMRGRDTVADVSAAIGQLLVWEQRLQSFAGTWGIVVVAVLVLALAIHAYRTRKGSLDRLWKQRLDDAFADYQRRVDAGETLPPLAPTSEMTEVQEAIAKHVAAYESLAGDESEQAESARRQIADRAYRLAAYHRALDISRRIDVSLDDVDIGLEATPAAGIREKVERFFVSRGLHASLSGVSRFVYLSLLALTLPVMASVMADAAAESIQSSRFDLSKLRLELQQREVRPESAVVAAIAPEDRQVLEEVAREFENVLGSHDVWAPFRGARSVYRMRSAIVAADIVQRTRETSRARLAQYATGSEIADLGAAERQVFAIEEAALRERGPVTRVGRDALRRLESQAQRQPGLMARLRSEWRAAARPASVGDISRSLMSEVFGTLADAVPGHPGTVLSGIDVPQPPHAVKFYQEEALRTFVDDLTRGDVTTALSNAKSSRRWSISAIELDHAHTMLRRAASGLPVDAIAAKVAESPAGLDVLPDDYINVRAATDEIVRLQQLSPRKPSADQITECLASYGDWFPGQQGTDAQTMRARAMADLGQKRTAGARNVPPAGGVERRHVEASVVSGPGEEASAAATGDVAHQSGQRSGRAAGADSSASARGRKIYGARTATPAGRAAFLRGRSFARLLGFSRVGGVLIGDTPQAGGRLDLADIRWEMLPEGRMRLVLVDASGREYRSTVHRASLVHQALSYAADGRPAAATMTLATPLPELKIHVHPALIDTAMGHRVIEIDRWVDSFVRAAGDGLAAEIEAEESRLAQQDAVYRLAWAYRLRGVVGDEKGEGADQLRAIAANVIADVRNLAAEALRNQGSELGDATRSLLRAKSAYYDDRLVGQIISVAERRGGVDALQAVVEAGLPVIATESDLERLVALPEFEVWSGVRERPFPAAIGHLLIAEGAAMPEILGFVLQVSFTSKPTYAADPATYADTPWTFPRLQERIERKVFAKAREQRNAATVVRDVTEFTMLQRLFRAALDGSLGDSFPVESLTALHAAAIRHAPAQYFPTPRWNPRADVVLRMALNARSDKDREYVGSIIRLRRHLGVDQPAAAPELPELR